MKKTFLVTGGAGFIGSNLVDKLIFYGEDINIICIDNFDSGYSEKIKQNNICLHRRINNYKLYVADITDYAILKKIFQANKITHIIHTAAKTGVRASLEKPDEYFKTNVSGTVNLLQLANEFGIEKFIFTSSSSVYGINKDVPFREDMNLYKPVSPYAASKLAGEEICYTYSHLFGINTVCLRLFSGYGPRQRPNAVIHKFSRQIAEGKPLQVFGSGSIIRDFTYIDDIVQGILAAVDYDESLYEIFNIGVSKPVKLDTLIGLIEEVFDRKALVVKRNAQVYDVPVTYADITKAKELLGYEPSTNLKRGLKKFMSWFKEFYNYSPCEAGV